MCAITNPQSSGSFQSILTTGSFPRSLSCAKFQCRSLLHHPHLCPALCTWSSIRGLSKAADVEMVKTASRVCTCRRCWRGCRGRGRMKSRTASWSRRRGTSRTRSLWSRRKLSTIARWGTGSWRRKVRSSWTKGKWDACSRARKSNGPRSPR